MISSTLGRLRASWFQHSWVNAHKPSARLGWVGRDGRSPPAIADMAARGGLSTNGAAPVKAFMK